MSNPCKLTPAIEATILAAIEAGNFKVTACQLAGVHRDTLNGWELRGAQGDEPYASFLTKLQAAESKAESDLLSEIRHAQGGTKTEAADMWTARAWILERRWPKRWAQRVRAHVNEELDALIKRLESKLDEATLAKVIDATREETPGEAPDRRH